VPSKKLSSLRLQFNHGPAGILNPHHRGIKITKSQQQQLTTTEAAETAPPLV
jgi:hypothetical protein